MAVKLSKLTKDQEKLIPITVDEWLRIGLSTTTNKSEAELGIKESYETAGLNPPETIIWLRSPFEGAIAVASLKVGAQVRTQVWTQVWDQVGDQVEDQVGDQVRAQVGAQVEAQVWTQVWTQVRAQVGAQVWAAIYGSHDAGWLSFYWFFEQCGIKTPNKLNGLMRVARNAGWWWAFEKAAIITENPILIKLNKKKLLHSDFGPAIEYSDGWSVYAKNGERLPEPSLLDRLAYENIRSQVKIS